MYIFVCNDYTSSHLNLHWNVQYVHYDVWHVKFICKYLHIQIIKMFTNLVRDVCLMPHSYPKHLQQYKKNVTGRYTVCTMTVISVTMYYCRYLCLKVFDIKIWYWIWYHFRCCHCVNVCFSVFAIICKNVLLEPSVTNEITWNINTFLCLIVCLWHLCSINNFDTMLGLHSMSNLKSLSRSKTSWAPLLLMC